jgi:hypothetical protein
VEDMAEPALQLNYAEPGTESTGPGLLAVKAAKWLGAIPLTLGCLIFIIWLIGRWDALTESGAFRSGRSGRVIAVLGKPFAARRWSPRH